MNIGKKINQILYQSIKSSCTKIIKLTINKQQYLTYTTLTQGLVYVNDFCVSYVLKNHDNMIPIYRYKKEKQISTVEIEFILDKKNSMKEKIENYIYLSDFTTHNILYNPNTQQLKIIDFEDSLTCYTKRNSIDEKIMLE